MLFNPIISFSLNTNSYFIKNKSKNKDILPQTSVLSKDNFTAILSNEKHSLGNITINDISFRELTLGFYTYNNTYPLVWEDYENNALNITLTDIKFIETVEPAIKDNLDENIVNRNKITLKINESLEVKYNNSQTGFLIYHGRLSPSRLIEFYVNNGTHIDLLDSETDYTIDSNDFIVFNFEDYYFRNASNYNFSIYLIWEYDITINPWDITQSSISDITIDNEEQNITAQFSYTFILTGRIFGPTIGDGNFIAEHLDVALTVNLPDVSSLDNYMLELNEESVNVNDHLNIDNMIEILISDSFSTNFSSFSLNFESKYTLKFIEPVENTWAIDRLVEFSNVRERIYFPSLIAGPKHLYLNNVPLIEPSIHYEEVLKAYSLFGRQVSYFGINASISEIQGVNISIPYLILGEICPFTIKYEPSQILNIIVTNNIKMPLVGARVEVYYHGQLFGTYISESKVQPIGLAPSNENGQIVLHNVPHGNYTVKVYYNGNFIKEAITSTINDQNFISTNIIHIPIWILIFATLNGFILIIGAVFYLKYKKKR